MRFRMVLRTNSVVLIAILLGVTSSNGDGTFDVQYDTGDYIPPPEYYPRAFASPQDWSPELTYTYAEVSTPFYHYHFYAPAIRTSPLEDSYLAPTSRGSYIPPYRNSKFPKDNFYLPQVRNPFSTQNLGDEYYSPQFNDVRYPSHEISTHKPKFYKQGFLERPYSTAFDSQGIPRESQKPLDLPQSFLPTVLSSGSSNIIRKEDQGRAVHDNMFRPYSYAPSYKGHTPHNIDQNPSPYKPGLNPSLFSSAAPNIIRDEVSSVNKLFKPVSTANTNNPSFFSNANSLTPSYPFTSQTTIGGTNRHYPLSSVSPSVSPSIFYSTRRPLTFETSEIPDYSLEETLSPLFTSSETPLEYFTTQTPLNAQSTSLYHGPSTLSSESPRVLFEAPGHTQPRRR